MLSDRDCEFRTPPPVSAKSKGRAIAPAKGPGERGRIPEFP
jgi:hypothetical protein